MTWGGDKVKNRGHFQTEVPGVSEAVAGQQDQAPKAPNPLASKGKLPVRAFWLVGFVILGLVACTGTVWPAVRSVADDLAEVMFGAVFTVFVVALHGLTSWWCLKAKPGWLAVVVVQVPFPVLYVMTWVWFKVGFSAAEGGPPSLWYLPWAAVASVSLSWLVVLWLRPDNQPRMKRVLASGLVVWLAVNGGGFALDRWSVSNGFGLKGFSTPRDTFAAFTATSCLFDTTWYTRGGKSVEAQCARYHRHMDNAPADGFEDTVSSDQPQEALKHWREATRRFRELQPLTVDYPITEERSSDKASLRVKVEAPTRQLAGDRAAFHCFANGRAETWTVHLLTMPLGGWKVERVEVDRAVTVVPFVGSPCDQ